MKILLYEKNKVERELFNKSLLQWGFNVQVADEETSVISILKQSSEIQLLIIGEFELDISELITQIRRLKQYVYVFLLFAPGKDQAEVSVLKENSDDCIMKPVDLPLLRYRIHMVKQVISFTFNVSVNSKKPIPTENRQVLNLDYVLKHVNSDRSQLKEVFQKLVKDVKQQRVDVNTINDPVWERLLKAAEAIGAEQLSDWLVGLLFLKFNSEHLTLVNFSLLQHQYSQIQERLSEAILCLGEFGFFSQKAENEKSDPLDNKRILLVEDMKYNRVLLKKILEKHNCSVVEAVNGEDAVECWKKEEKFDLIIMDMNMPVMDGFQATKIIRDIEDKQDFNRTPIIALTALAMRGDRELCIEAGTDDYLPKPVEANSLIKICEKLLIEDETRFEDFASDFPNLEIKRVLMKTDNQIYFYSLEIICKRLGLEFEHCNSTSEILEKVSEEEFDVLVLNAEYNLEVAYFIKNNFPKQFVILITAAKSENSLLRLKANNNLYYPFSIDQVCAVLKLYSEKLKLVKKHAERLADVDSLSKIKGQAGIEEAVLNSNQQLAVWQKAFRKIGGDLVLSHQFNLHGRFGLILGDVAGHDIQSGYTASWFSGLVKGVWGQNSNPFDLLIYLNNLFAHNVEEENKRFVCSLALLWDSLRSKLYYANAGIPGGILIKKDTGKAEMIEWKGVPIGMFPDMEMFDHGVIDFTEGDRLVMATDGVLEAVPGEIISGLSESKSDQSAQQALDAIVDFVTRSIEIVDDLTIAVFEGKKMPEPDVGFRRSIKSDFKMIDQTIEIMEQFIQEHVPEQFDWPIVSVAIREAFLNAVEHGNKNNPELPVDVDFELKDSVLHVKISDCGSGFDLPSEKKRLAKEGELRIHGRGIEMMENIGQSVSYQGGGIHLEFNTKDHI